MPVVIEQVVKSKNLPVGQVGQVFGFPYGTYMISMLSGGNSLTSG